MTHLGTQYIETDRLVLRKLERSDAQSFLDNIAADDEVKNSWLDGLKTARFR